MGSLQSRMDAVGISGGDDDHKGHHSAASSGDFETSSDDDESKEPSPEPIVIELTAEELAALEAERVRREKEEAEKRAVNEVAYRKVLHSKLVMESVELCKRTGERLNWVLFTPNGLHSALYLISVSTNQNLKIYKMKT